MRFIILHYHFRPGGVRRVIELATPEILNAARSGVDQVILAGGEAPDSDWDRVIRQRLENAPFSYFIDPSFGYVAEQNAPSQHISRAVRQGVRSLIQGGRPSETLVWAHNLGIARNIFLARELAQACHETGATLISHHHDWWFDNRWQRWTEMKTAGAPSLRRAAEAVFPSHPTIRHVGINQAEAGILKRQFGRQSAWIPNPGTVAPRVSKQRKDAARAWLRRRLNISDDPIWIVPCRMLRRKNMAEALLLARWLRPEAWLVTTGGVTCHEEASYADRLRDAVKRHQWKLRLSILGGPSPDKPSVEDLLAASEAVLLTSIQEGFGLPYLEAAASRRPLIARALPNVAADLKRFGLQFPQYYDEILIDPSLFDWNAERRRQRERFRSWRAQLPLRYRGLIKEPGLLNASAPREPAPFSRLTLTAQLEILAVSASTSWQACAPLNPFLDVWKTRAARGKLGKTPWPDAIDEWIGLKAYARRIHAIANAAPLSRPADPMNAQEHFVKETLASRHSFPILWSTEA